MSILDDIGHICETNGIIPILALFPHSDYYLNCLDGEYGSELVEVLNNMSSPFHFLDMNDYPEFFNDDDFRDADHVSESGAIKATKLVDKLIYEIMENI